MNIIRSEFYQRVSELDDSIMNYIEENGPYSLDQNSSKIKEIIETEMRRNGMGDCRVEITDPIVVVNLYLEDDWDTYLQITLNFYAKIKDLFTPLLEVNLREFKDKLKKSLIPIVENFDQEELTDPEIEDAINQVLTKAIMWIESNGYQLEWNRKDKSIKVHLSDESVQISLNIF